MKKISCFLISVIIAGQIYASEDFSCIANSFVERFYRAEEIEIFDLYSLVKDKQKEYLNTAINKDETLYELLLGATSLSYCMTYYDSKENRNILSDIEKNISADIKKIRDEKILNQYVKYLYSKIAWTENNFSIIESLPLWYEKNLHLNKSKEALLWYSVWYTNAVTGTEVNWISFIKDTEYLTDELHLSSCDLFNIYLAYAIFYIKINETKKGFEYLGRADKLFPNSYSAAILENNFKNGR